MFETLRKMIGAIAATQENEVACDEAYRFFDELAEAVHRGADAREFMPEIEHHLRLCPECKEDFEALLRSLEGVSSSGE